MKKINRNLFNKKIDVKNQSSIIGGSYKNSGGTEEGPTDGGNDTYTNVYNDDCRISARTVMMCQ